MASFREGDVVARRSYKMDVLFKIMHLFVRDDGKEYALLKGLDFRLVCDAPLEDLVLLKPDEVAAHRRQVFFRNSEIIRRSLARRTEGFPNMRDGGTIEAFTVPGKVLHIDGDRDYVEFCITT